MTRAVPGWLRTASARGALAFGAVVLAGQLTALAVWAGGGPGSPITTPRIGWLYACAFLGVPLRIVTRNELSGSVGLTLLAGTLVLVWGAFSAGRRAARAVPGRVAPIAGAAVGPVVGALTLAVAAVMGGISVVVPRNPIVGDVEVRPELLAAFVVPALIAGAAGAAGGCSVAGERSLARAAVVGGSRMLVVGLLGAFGFTLVLAATRPDATAAYVRALTTPSGAVTAAAAGHHALALPNQSVWLLAAGIGACDRVVSDRVDIVVVCPRTIPDAISLDLLTPGTGAAPATRRAPWEFFALPLVPIVATVAGGVRAARLTPAGLPAAAAGAAAGVVFAVALAVSARLAGVTLAGELLAGADGAVRYGPDPGVVFGLGLLWGVAGGIIGALASRRWPGREP